MLNRRTVLLSASSTLVLAGCKSICMTDYAGQPPNDNFEHPIIDVHCHTFNARDVPMVEFGCETVLREMGLTVLKPFVKPLLERYAAKAWSVEREQNHRGFAALPDNTPNLANDIVGTDLNLEAIYDAVLVDLQAEAKGTKSNPEFTQDEIAEALVDLAADAPTGVTKRLLSTDKVGVVSMSRSDVTQLAVQTADNTRAKSTERGGLFSFMANLVRTRVDLTSRAVALAGPQSRVRMITPSTNDYDLWYGIAPGSAGSSSSMREQVDLAANIALYRTPENALVNGIVAFDPLRQVYAEILGTADEKPLDLVRDAVRSRGFVGIKLYPPMGYRPGGNAGRDFGASRASAIIKRITQTAKISNPNFDMGQALDDALDQLYRFCLDEGVAILAHCSNSQSTYRDSGLNAAPEYWRAVLDRPSFVNPEGRVRNYSDLRLNLAHASGIWCVTKSTGACADSSKWRDDLFSMLTAGTAAVPTYPNLYCDMADADVLTDERGRFEIASYIESAVSGSSRGPDVLKRILYGTDWYMLSKAKSVNEYLGSLNAFFKDLSCRIGDGVDRAPDMIWRNASRYIGLVPQGAARERLRYFYRVKPEALDLLDKLTVDGGAPDTPQSYQCEASERTSI